MVPTIWIFVLSALAGWLLDPWWVVAVIAFAIALGTSLKTGGHAFVAGFVGVGMVWFLLPSWTYFSTGGILSTKVSVLLKLPSPILLIGITGLVGGLVGGFSAMSGHYLQVAIWGEAKVEDQGDREVSSHRVMVVIRQVFLRKKNFPREGIKESLAIEEREKEQ